MKTTSGRMLTTEAAAEHLGCSSSARACPHFVDSDAPEQPAAHAIREHMSAPTPALTVAAVALALGVHHTTIRREIRKGTLRAIRVGRVLRVPASELERRLATLSNAATH